MRSMMLLAAVMLVGCVDEPADDIVVTTFPDRLAGTFTQDGTVVDFEVSPTQVIVKTSDGQPVFEATLRDGAPITTKVVANVPEWALVEPLRDVLASGSIECPAPLLPRWWWGVDGFEMTSLEQTAR